MAKKSIFDQFTRKYQLSKTLRFELKPIGKTAEFLKTNKVFEKDKLIDDNYHKIKYYFDKLHQKFIKESFNRINFNFSNYYKKLLALKKNDQKSQKEFRDEETKLRRKLVKTFNETAGKWKKNYKRMEIELGQEGVEILFEKDNLEILKEEFKKKPDERDAPDIEYTNPETGKKENLFERFKGFTTYFSNFNNSRKNFYSDKDKDTAVANRAINENLRKFCDNIRLFNDKKSIYEKIGLTAEEREIFELNYYNSCLTQQGIDSYNAIIGRRKENEGEKGLNQKINEHFQKTKEKISPFKKLDNQIMGGKDKPARFIEITSDKQAFDVLKVFIKENDEKIKKAKQIFSAFIDSQLADNDKYDINKIYLKKAAINTISRKFFGVNWLYFENALPKRETSSKEEKYKLDGFISVQEIRDALLGNQKELPKKWKYLSKIEMEPKDLFRESYRSLFSNSDDNWETFLKAWQNEFEKLIEDKTIEDLEENESYKYRKEEIEREVIKNGVLNKDRLVREEKKNGSKIRITETSIVKMYADSALAVFQMMKYFALEKGRESYEPENGSDPTFYNEFDEYYKDHHIIGYYNEFRNYLTKKDFLGRLLFPAFGVENNKEYKHPLSRRKTDMAEKIKLNFDNGTLLDGWDLNKEADNYCVILRQKSVNKYFLVIMTPDTNHFFNRQRNPAIYNVSNSEWGKMEYKYLPDASKMIPKCSTQLTNVKKHFESGNSSPFLIDDSQKFSKPLNVTKRIFDLNNTLYDKNNISHITEDKKNGVKKFQKEYLSISKDNVGYRKALNDWINFCKDFLSSYKSCDFFEYSNLQNTETYQSLDKFYGDVDTASYHINFVPIKKEELDRLLNTGGIYFFQIYNKDFFERRKGKENLHTLYFKGLFKDLFNPFVQLCGRAEAFFRPNNEGIKKEKIITKDKKRIIEKDGVYHHRRYIGAEDNDLGGKIFVHIPIVLNWGTDKKTDINYSVNSLLFKNKNLNIIGIDRGENNLAYYSVIDEKGKILDSGSFNKIEMKDKNGKIIRTVDYLKLLEGKAKNRDAARKNWQTIENIKELKSGYISQVIRKICDLILKYNAVVIFEDLSGAFKRSRMKIEKQVYQKLELALVKKLNYLVNKDALEGTAGHYLRAYQLTSPVANYKDIGKQTGIIFYMQAGYTSKTCPVCGYRKNIGNSLYFETEDKTEIIVKKFKRFEYDNAKKCFRLEYDLNEFRNGEWRKQDKKSKNNELYSDKAPKDEFRLYSSNMVRYKWHDKSTERAKIMNRGEEKISETERGIVKKYNITECLIGLFENNGVNYKNGDLREAIVAKNISAKAKKAKFYKDLFYLISIWLDTRSSVSADKNEERIDYIQCPECGFDSRGGFKEREYNGDANGAYNIARKGIMILDKIKQFGKHEDVGKITWGDISANIDEWDKYAQIIAKQQWNPASKSQK